jgi:uncharacterized protein (TIGR03437 family)
MHPSTQMNQAHKRRWNRAATLGLAAIASLFLPALCSAQTPPVYTVTTIAGSIPPSTGPGVTPTKGYGGDGLPALSATLNGPSSVAFDSKGNMYIADTVNNVIRMVAASSGNISTVAGNNSAGYAGDGKQAVSAQIHTPYSIAVDSKGNFYFSDFENAVVRMVNTSGIISTFAGSQSEGRGYSGDGGAATAAAMSRPTGIAFDSSGNMYISDYGTGTGANQIGNDRIREVLASTGIISTIAGDGTVGYSNGNGTALSAELNGVGQIALDTHGNLYLADSINNEIRKIVLSTGTISTFAGSAIGVSGYSGDEGQAANALLNNPTGVAVDSAGNVYICDTFNDVIRMVTPDGIIHTIAGSTVNAPTPGYGGDGGPALSALFNEPVSVIVDASGNLYVCDVGNDLVRKLVPSSAPPPPATAPAIRTAGGVISASDFGALPSIAPGSWIEIYGTNLATASRQWATTDFSGIDAPVQLNNTTVSIGGQSAFVEYISPTQVNVQVPGTIGLGAQPVIVNTPAGNSAAYNVNVTLEQPGLFAPAAFKIVGVPYVGALFPDGAYVFPPDSFSGIVSRAAKPGDTIVIYGIGFAPVPGSPAGTIPQVANGLGLTIPPKFYFNGKQAQVTYYGLAPQNATTGYIGLYQFNVVVPPLTVPVGTPTAVALTFSVNENGTDVPGAQTLYTSVEN